VRNREGAALVVAGCYRYRGHYEGDLDGYRSREEKELAMGPDRDPIARLRARLLAAGSSVDDLEAIEFQATEQVREWFRAARKFPLPLPETLRDDLFAL
jgi:pyruvate dehydrogenase E1 component alpha subunit